MPQKPFFRRHDNWWVVQLRQGRKRWQHKLCEGSPPRGKDTEKEAYTLFNELMAAGSDNIPPPTKIRVADMLRAFLNHSSQNNSKRTESSSGKSCRTRNAPVRECQNTVSGIMVLSAGVAGACFGYSLLRIFGAVVGCIVAAGLVGKFVKKGRYFR